MEVQAGAQPSADRVGTAESGPRQRLLPIPVLLLTIFGPLLLMWAAVYAGALPPWAQWPAHLGQGALWHEGLAMVASMYGVMLLSGLLVRRFQVRVNYTRKINHFALFFFPIFLGQSFAYERSALTSLLSGGLILLVLASFVRPVRERVGLLALMFLSFDRPEDRPYTLVWLVTQIVAGFAVLVPLLVVFSAIGHPELIYIPILITAIGDGFAEPVGVRFGRHAYSVRALFTEQRYVRTLEGSACVFVAGVVIVGLFAGSFTMPQLWLVLLFVPLVMTLAEAFSPHTWDSPWLYLSGGLALVAILLLCS